jgi:SAM-dependent methyltransferase
MYERLPGLFPGTEMPTEGWWETLWPEPAKVVEAVGLAPGMNAVDLCSGDGWFTLAIGRVARQVIAIDLDPRLLEVARARLAESGIANGTLFTADACDVGKLVKEPVDFVFMANVFHGVPDQPGFARSVRQVLKSDGRFAIVNWHQRPREETTILGQPRGPRTELRLSPQETIRTVESGGFKRAQLVELPPYHYGITFKPSSA